MMDFYANLDTLIRELDEFVEDRYVSIGSAEKDGGHLAPDPIEAEWPELYEAVQALESFYTDSRLPMGAWEQWNQLLTVSRQSGDDARRGREAYLAANALREWATSERNGRSEPSNRDDGPAPDEIGVVYCNGQRYMVSKQSWNLLLHLWEGGDGKPFLELGEKVWGQETKQSTIRAAISRLNVQLADNGIPWQIRTHRERAFLDKST